MKVSRPNEVYEQVLACVQALTSQGHKHINVCWPTSTTSLFMRKRMNRDLGPTFAIRNTTATQLRSLIEDAYDKSKKYNPPNTLEELSHLAEIAKVVLPNMPHWPSTPLIDQTLQVCSSANPKARDYIKSNFPLAQMCIEEFKQVYGYELPYNYSSKPEFNVDHIVGLCIVIKISELDQDSDFLINTFPSNIAQIINSNQDTKNEVRSLSVHEDCFQEIDSVFKDIVNRKPDPNSTSIIIPDSKYRKIVQARANKFSVPISGKSTRRLFDNELIVCANTLLTIGNNPSESVLDDLIERFSWLKSTENNNHILIKQLMAQIENIYDSNNISHIFKIVLDILKKNFSTGKLKTIEEISITQEVFSALIELSELDQEGTIQDCIYLLNLVGDKVTRAGTLGDGIYIATPDEVIGTYFDFAYVVGLRDKYIPQLHFEPSLIDRDQYVVLGIKDEGTSNTHIEDSLNWLKNCAENIFFSSSQIDPTGKETAFPHWVNTISQANTKIKVENKINNLHYDSDFINRMLNQSANINNFAVKCSVPESISATAVETLATCPLKYLYRHRFKLSSTYENYNSDFFDSADIGIIIHNLLQNYIEKKQTPDELFAIVDELVNEAFKKGELPNKASIAHNKAKLNKILSTFLLFDEEKLSENIQCEVEIENEVKIKNQSIKLKGKVDRMDNYSNGTTHLVDYKTGSFKNARSTDFYHFGRRLQLGIYSLLLKDQKTISAIEYWYLSEPTQVCSEQLTPEEIIKLDRKVKNILTILFSGEFLAKPFSSFQTENDLKEIDNCSTCEFSEICYQEYRDAWESLSIANKFHNFTKATVGKKDDNG